MQLYFEEMRFESGEKVGEKVRMFIGRQRERKAQYETNV